MDAGSPDPSYRPCPPDEVGPLGPRHSRQAADMLARALLDDPGYAHLVPQRSRRLPVLRALYRMTLADTLRHGTVLATTLDGAVTGVLALCPPRTYPMTTARWLRQALRVAVVALLAREHSLGLVRFGDLTASDVPTDSWYVMAFGVCPERQRQGRGGMLLRAFFGDLDRAGDPSYLETTKGDNVDYYRRRGYVEEHRPVPLGPGGPLIHPLGRPAAQRTAPAPVDPAPVHEVPVHEVPVRPAPERPGAERVAV